MRYLEMVSIVIAWLVTSISVLTSQAVIASNLPHLQSVPRLSWRILSILGSYSMFVPFIIIITPGLCIIAYATGLEIVRVRRRAVA